MISFNNIGHMGRLGNQMFQYAALKGISKHKGYWYSVPKENVLNECFQIPETLSNQNYQSINEKKFEFDQDFFDNCPDNVDIIGYFQSEKYFKHIEQEIRQDFTFYDIIYNKCAHYRKYNFSNSELISLHIRRTDYITDTNFECLPIEYYFNALELLPSTNVMVFSDDPNWCKSHFNNQRFTISLSKDPYIDLCLMSMCDYHIIANSSYSWWGSWLSKSKKTIAPRNWFCGEFSNWNTKDLYLSDWTVL
jgi:hypothetical protein